LPLPIAEFLFGANGRHRVARPGDTPIWRTPGRPGGFSFASRKRFARWTTADALAALQVLLRARHFALSGPHWLGHFDDLSGWRRISRKSWADHGRQKCNRYKNPSAGLYFSFRVHPSGRKDRTRQRLSGAGQARAPSGKCDGEQARAKQDKTGNGHSEETVRSEFFTHSTPPTVREIRL
jgi:hypothetical protein